jgi:broad specificity phosphatase PhoE
MPERILVIGVRHGRTEGNEGAAVLRAWEDYPLDRNGEMDADIAGMKVRQWNPTIVYHDDLIRAMQTGARIAAQNENIPTEVEYGLRTADMGEWTARPETEVTELVLRWYQNPWDLAPGGESYFQFIDRFFPRFDDKLDLSRRVTGFNPVVAVMHGRNFAALHSRYGMLPPEKTLMPLPGGIGLIKENTVGELSIEFPGPTEPVHTDA